MKRQGQTRGRTSLGMGRGWRQGVWLLVAAILAGLCGHALTAQSRVSLAEPRGAPENAAGAAEEPNQTWVSRPSMGFVLAANGAVFEMAGIPGSARLMPVSVEFPRGSDARAIAAAGSTVLFAERHRELLRVLHRLGGGAMVESQIETPGQNFHASLSPNGNALAVAVAGEDNIRVLTLANGRAQEVRRVPRVDSVAEIAFLRISNDGSRIALGYERGDQVEVYESEGVAQPRYLGVFPREAQAVLAGNGEWIAVFEPQRRMLSLYSNGVLATRGNVAGESEGALPSATLVEVGNTPMVLDVAGGSLVACRADMACVQLPARMGRIAHASALGLNGLASVVPEETSQPVYVIERSRQGTLAAHFVAQSMAQ